jgi:hypothetical protein
MQTYTGRKFDVLSPRAEDVSFVDVAHALAHQCRFNGHTKQFYSVAHHCVIMSREIPPEFALYALLHDAGEAYIGDIPQPVKACLSEIRAIEEGVLAAVYEAAGIRSLDEEAERLVRLYDLKMLLTERQQLMGEPPEPWALDSLNIEPINIRISCEPDFEIYKGRYLRRLVELGVNVDTEGFVR